MEDDDVFDVVNAPEKGALWEGTIKSYNRGGIIIKAGTRRAFCPYSRLDPMRQEEIDFKQTPFECTAILNKPIKCVVTEVRSTRPTALPLQQTTDLGVDR